MFLIKNLPRIVYHILYFYPGGMLMEARESIYPADKQEMYALLRQQLTALMEGEPFVLPRLCNAAALVYSALGDINWAGFYLMEEGALLLGPFQGRPACVRIPLGMGVCGTAAADNRTIVVEDVHRFPGHIACDSASNSEIVIPLRMGGVVVGVLDIDSPLLNRFDERDRLGLEELAEQLTSAGWRHSQWT
jgi:L-methionine (R)-S-oxide reductase